MKYNLFLYFFILKMLSYKIKTPETLSEDNNIIKEDNCQQDKKYKLLKILENIFEIDSEEKKTKRKNSFNSLNISINKIFNNKKIIYRKKTKNIEGESKFKFISLLKKSNDKKNIKTENSFSIRTKEKTEKEIDNSLEYNLRKRDSLGKNSNLSFNSYKTINSKNFILKSKLYELNNMDKLMNNKNGKKIDIILTHKQIKEELNNNYNNFNDNENQNKIISSNTYMDNEEENEKIEKLINSNINIKNNENLLNNYFKNNSSNLIRNYLMDETYNNNLVNIENQNNNKQSINKFLNYTNNNILNDKEENLNNQFLGNNLKENQKLFQKISNNNQIQEGRNEKKINNNKKENDNLNNNINKSHNFFTTKIVYNNFIENYPNKLKSSYENFYPFNQSPLYYKNNLNLFPYYNDNSLINNQYINEFNQYNPNNLNRVIINNNFINDKAFLLSNINYLVKNQIGCNILKQKSLEDHKFANDKIFSQIKNNLKEICCDFFGSSLIETLLDILTKENIDSFITLIDDTLYDICITEPGSRIIQKLIEKIYDSTLLLNKFIFSLNKKDIGILFKSSYGNYILKKYLSVVKNKGFKSFIYDYIFNNFLIIIKDKYGVCVIQKSLSEADNKQKKKLFEYTLLNFQIIIKDCYGNFFIHYIIRNFYKGEFDEILPIIEKIEENIVDYCKCKFSASVIEKCIERGDQQIKEHIIKYLLDNYSNSIISILINPYGYYIIKKSMNIQNNHLKKEIIRIIINNKDTLKKAYNGKNIISTFSSEFKQFPEIV